MLIFGGTKLAELRLFTGTVRKLHPVTRNRVQIELQETRGVFELFIDQSWVLSPTDLISIAGTQDETGKIVCYAYENRSKNVKGWNNTQSNSSGYFFVVLSLIFVFFGLTMFPPHLLAIVFTIYGLRSVRNTNNANEQYESARQIVEGRNQGQAVTQAA